ncbi:MAG: hypothetical protein COA49_04965 [Bacteroidetes bacterium]|nr:MAG: hypothetical protein COA49_04965 [Bacteroidota bacterium]
MRKLLISLIILCSASTVSYAITCSYLEEVFDSDSLVKDTQTYLRDLDTLLIWIEDLHPLPYARISKEDFQIAFNRAKKEVESLKNEKEFLYIVSELLKELRDSHTGISLGVWYKETLDKTHKTGTYLPKLINVDSGLYVMSDGSGNLSSGDEINEINGFSSSDIFFKALKLSPIEGNSFLSNNRAAGRLCVATALHDSPEGSDLFINGIEYLPIKQTKKKKKRFTGINWDFENEISYLKISTFSSTFNRKYSKAIKRGFKELNKSRNKNIKCLVIDLRGNTGGYLNKMLEIFDYLPVEKNVRVKPNSYIFRKSPESNESVSKYYKGVYKKIVEKRSDKNEEFRHIRKVAELKMGEIDTLFFKNTELVELDKWKGQTILLIDGISASASVAFASYFKKFKLGYILGEPCMGPLSGTFGDPVLRVLPESGVSIEISTARMVLFDDYTIGSRSIQPHRWVQWSIDDLISENDPFNEAIQDCINFPEVGQISRLHLKESELLWTELDKVFSKERLWGGEVRSAVWSKILNADECISKCTGDIGCAETVRDCEDRRNIAIKVSLPISLRSVFDEIFYPQKPAVLHFGIHNRADCKVCKPN